MHFWWMSTLGQGPFPSELYKNTDICMKQALTEKQCATNLLRGTCPHTCQLSDSSSPDTLRSFPCFVALVDSDIHCSYEWHVELLSPRSTNNRNELYRAEACTISFCMKILTCSWAGKVPRQQFWIWNGGSTLLRPVEVDHVDIMQK